MLNIEDVLESLSSPLLGIIPESEEVLCASNIGAPVTLKARTREIRRALSNFPTALDDFVQYATSQGSARRTCICGYRRPRKKVALCSRDMPPHPFTPSNKNRRQLFRPALSTLFDLIM
jgi:hypothetical protein